MKQHVPTEGFSWGFLPMNTFSFKSFQTVGITVIVCLLGCKNQHIWSSGFLLH